MNAEELGRTMMHRAGDLIDDRQCCDWARVGQILTQLGSPRMPKTIRDLSSMDQGIIIDAIRQLQLSNLSK